MLGTACAAARWSGVSGAPIDARWTVQLCGTRARARSSAYVHTPPTQSVDMSSFIVVPKNDEQCQPYVGWALPTSSHHDQSFHEPVRAVLGHVQRVAQPL